MDETALLKINDDAQRQAMRKQDLMLMLTSSILADATVQMVLLNREVERLKRQVAALMEAKP